MLKHRLPSLAVLFALPLITGAAAHADVPAEGWRLEVNHTGVANGARLAWRLAWHNGTKADVDVPADLLDRMVPRAERLTPGAASIGIGGLRVAANPDTLSGPTMKVPAATTLERVGWLDELLPECRQGCPPGAYTLRFEDHGALPPFVPPVATQFTLAPPPGLVVVPVQARNALDVRAAIVGVNRQAGRATLRVTVVNRLQVPLWFPKSPRVVGWSGRTELSDGVGGGFGSVSGHQSNTWGPDEAVLLKPGQRRVIDLPYSDDFSPRHMWLSVHLAAPGPFVADDPKLNPFAFFGDFQSDEIQVY